MNMFQLTSPAFADGGMMPERFSCEGANISPELAVSNVPIGAVSLAIIVHDPDAPHGDYIHWTLWNIPPNTGHIAEGKTPGGAIVGTNDFGHIQYDGPCPPSGIHRYMFDLYALDAMLDLRAGAPEEDIRLHISDHAIAKTTLTGRFGAKALA